MHRHQRNRAAFGRLAVVRARHQGYFLQKVGQRRLLFAFFIFFNGIYQLVQVLQAAFGLGVFAFGQVFFNGGFIARRGQDFVHYVRRGRNKHIRAPSFHQAHKFHAGAARHGRQLRHGLRGLQRAVYGKPVRLRISQQTLLRRFAQPAGGSVYHAQQAHIVIGVNQQTRITEHIFDFFAVVETDGADQPVRDLVTAEGFFKVTALRIGAVKHGNVV